MSSELLYFSSEVADAIAQNKPIVAFESTIISHGMPYPANLETAIAVENIARSQNVTPATIAVVNGKIHIGLSTDELEQFGKNSTNTLKLSRRDMAYAIATKKTGATTVATTMICADLARIRVFATGGIGGVHRGGESTLDISADLQELANTNVAVVCAGIKSILDIGRTLEVLETLGVPVIGYQTNQFPAFYCQKSGFKADYQVDTPSDIAAIMDTKWQLGLKGGIVVGNPLSAQEALDSGQMELVIHQALFQASKDGITGKAVTPYLLAKINEFTSGKSLQCNIAIIKNNAKLATMIAKEWTAIQGKK